MNDFRDSVARIFVEHLNIEAPSQNTDLFESGLLDSLAFIELLLQLERELGVVVAPEELDLDNFRTINCIADFAASRSSPSNHDVEGLRHDGAFGGT